MRYGITKEIDWEYLGAILANADDTQQAAFFKSFIKECKSWGTQHQVEFQLAGINQLLTDDEKNIIGMLGYEDNE